MKIAEKIEEIRQEKRIAITEIAEKLGITAQGYYKAIKTDNFKISQLRKIADVLGVSISDLLGNSTDKIIVDFFSVGLTDKNKNTEDNPLYFTIYTNIEHQYFTFLFGFLDGMKHRDTNRPNLAFLSKCEPYRKEKNVLELIKNVYSEHPDKNVFIKEFEKRNDSFTDMIYNDTGVLYLMGKGFFEPVLLSKILRKVLINAAEIC